MSKTPIVILVSSISGAILGYLYSKNKYMKEAEKEVSEMREYYNQKNNPTKKDESKVETKIVKNIPGPANSSLDIEKSKKEKKEYLNYASQYGDYSGLSIAEAEIKANKELARKDEQLMRPYPIGQDEIAMSEYDTRTLYLYKDNVLADDDNIELSNSEIEEYIGKENLTIFRDHSDVDCTYIRNDKLRIDYEILISEKCFSELKHIESPTDFPQDE